MNITRAAGRLGRFRMQLRVGPEQLMLSYLDLPGDGLPVVFIHGAGGCAVQWEEQAERLAGRHRVLVVDLRGHGQSDKPDTHYRTSDFMGDMLAWIEAVDLPERFALVGHSFGGYLATLITHAMPRRVARVALMNTTGNIKHLGVLPRTAANLPAVIIHAVHRAVPVLLSMPPHVARRFVKEALAEWECWDTYPRLECPSLVITGSHDHVAPPLHAQRMASLLPNSRLHVVALSRHMTMIERSRHVSALLEQFLGDELPQSHQEEHVTLERTWSTTAPIEDSELLLLHHWL